MLIKEVVYYYGEEVVINVLVLVQGIVDDINNKVIFNVLFIVVLIIVNEMCDVDI